MASITYLHVRARSGSSSAGRLSFGQTTIPCLLGRNGRTHLKREGDGASPVGVWNLGGVYFRADRLPRLVTRLPVRISKPVDAWCEDPRDGRYNRKISLPPGEGNETFWRADEAYDIVIPTNHNARPRVRGAGSAIFFHLTRKGSSVTAGCVAVSVHDMRKILARCSAVTCLVIWPPEGGPPVVLRRSRSQRGPATPPPR
jgi:L,D-peptidoglycan transpeptidase YkuD (ErfK/YbiS/YcfS/YnhG family)